MRRILAAVALLVIAGCGSRPAPGETGALAVSPTSARFDCGGEIVPVVFHADRSVITLSDRELNLPQTVAASGARYSDGSATFWNKGPEATFEIDGRTVACRELPDPWRDAGRRGVDFRAVGQEPGWLLEIDEGRSLRLVYDYAEREATAPAPRAVAEPGRTTYRTSTDAHTITVVIEDRRCADGMSGEPFPATVTVTIDGRELTGCGRPVVLAK